MPGPTQPRCRASTSPFGIVNLAIVTCSCLHRLATKNPGKKFGQAFGRCFDVLKSWGLHAPDCDSQARLLIFILDAEAQCQR